MPSIHFFSPPAAAYPHQEPGRRRRGSFARLFMGDSGSADHLSQENRGDPFSLHQHTAPDGAISRLWTMGEMWTTDATCIRREPPQQANPPSASGTHASGATANVTASPGRTRAGGAAVTRRATSLPLNRIW